MRKSAIPTHSHSLEQNFSTSQQTLGLGSPQQSSHRLSSSLEEDTTQMMSHNSRRSKMSGVLSLTRGTTDASSIVAYSTCVLLTLSTLWSVSLGMATGGGESISLLNSSSPMLSIRSAAVIHEQGDEADRHHHPHKCYVCLPPDKTSIDAQNILKLFSGQSIPPCASLTLANLKSAQFECPPDFSGCQTRSHGSNVSRSCTRLNINDCKTANSVELCYCTGPLCNDQKLLQPLVGPSPSSPPVQVEGNSSEGAFVETESEEREKQRLSSEKEDAEARKIFQKGETDDEDLLEMQDDDNGSGNGQDGLAPPGVIDHYTTTPKPTLIPNKRGDSTRFKTTPPPASKAAVSVVPTILHLLLFVVFLVTPQHTFF